MGGRKRETKKSRMTQMGMVSWRGKERGRDKIRDEDKRREMGRVVEWSDMRGEELREKRMRQSNDGEGKRG